MKTIFEVWKKGILIHRTEHEDGIPTLEELNEKVQQLEMLQK